MAEELSQKLARRQQINEGNAPAVNQARMIFNPYTEFHEFSRKEIQRYESMFKKFDVGKDQFIDFEELKRMMEVLGAPQTHLSLKQMIADVDEDKDGKISFREFLLIYRKAKSGDLSGESGLSQLASLTEIDVHDAGVGGAKHFFEAKIAAQQNDLKFEEEIKIEQEEKRKFEEDKKLQREQFKQKARLFDGTVAS